MSYEPWVIPVQHAKLNFLALKDVHAAAVAPGRRRGSYGDEILAKLVWAGATAEAIHGHVLCAGDLTHFKSPTHPGNAYRYITALGDVLRSYPGGLGMFGVVGNHDITADNLETLPGQPLGNLIMAGAYWDLSMRSVIFEGSEGLRVRIDGYDFERDARVIMEAMQSQAPDPSCHYRMAIAHCFGTPGRSTPMFGEFAVGFDDVATAPYDVFLWGHDHKPKGIIDVGHQRHLYLGALSRAALKADEADRPVTVAVVSFSAEGIKVIEREVPTTPLELAFHTATLDVERADLRPDVVEQRSATSQFLAKMQEHAEAIESDDPGEILCTITDDPAIIKEISDACDLH